MVERQTTQGRAALLGAFMEVMRSEKGDALYHDKLTELNVKVLNSIQVTMYPRVWRVSCRVCRC